MILRGLLDGAVAGRSGTLLLSGAPGSGKTALLEEAVRLASGSAQVLRGAGVESESELPFAALQAMIRPAQDCIDGLPEPQAVALRRAVGLSSTGGSDRFLVGLAVLTLLSDLAEAGPVLCVVDDAQWVDQPSANALLFAARRLQLEGVVMVFAAREGFDAPGISHQVLAGLDRRSALAMLAERRPGLAASARERILSEAGGNPLALIELPSMHRTRVGPLPLPRRLQQAYEADIAKLPEATRLLLLLVAADESGELATILPPAHALGLTTASITPAERAGLLVLTEDVVRFRHPLMRAAAYNGMPYDLRLTVHTTLAGVVDDDRRAWHLAAAATGPDETVATELHEAAERAELRGGNAAAAVAYERAAALSTDEHERARRLAAAAYAASSSGRLNQSAELAMNAERLIADPPTKARLMAIRAEAAFENGQPARAYELLLDGARMLAGPDPEAAALMLFAAIQTGHAADVRMVDAAALTLQLDLPVDHSMQPLLAVARTVARWEIDGAVVAPPPYDLAVEARDTMTVGLRDRLAVAKLVDLAYGRVESADTAAAIVAGCRREGRIGLLPQALLHLSVVELNLNRWRSGYAHAHEALRIVEDTGQDHTATWLRLVVAWAAGITGDEDRAAELTELSLRSGPTDGTGAVSRQALRVLCLMDLGRGRYAEVLDRIDALGARTESLEPRLAAQRIEAATRLGQPERAGPIADLADLAETGGHPVKVATILRSRAMLATSAAEADEHFRKALASINEVAWPFAQARTELLYGEWLRRARRKKDARTHLRTALRAFDRMGARPWAERTRRELRASGDSVERAHAANAAEQLTPQELQIVQLAATGLTNREIAAQLFLSPKTVGHHLYRAFPKLGVATRTELARLDLD